MMLGTLGVELADGIARNSFEAVELGSEFEVLVPNLVKVDGEEIKPIFELFTEVDPQDEEALRIMARCLGETACHQNFLVDEGDRRITEYFRPQAGLELGDSALPSVHMHAFSWVGLMRKDVSALYEEAYSEPAVIRMAQKQA